MSISRREFAKLVAAGGAAQAAARRPNIVFILADDLRFDDLSAVGNTVLRTPNPD
jgi:arylsulfatase A-like enzyme